MIKPVFNINPGELNSEAGGAELLLMEVNEQSFTYIILDENKKLLAAAYYVLPHQNEKNIADSLRELIRAEPLLQHEHKQAIVAYNFSESMLIPNEYYDHDLNREMLELGFGNLRKGLVLNEHLDAISAHTVYRVPVNVHSVMQQEFTAGRYWHIYTLWIQSVKEKKSEFEDRLHIIFEADKMVVAVFKSDKLQLVQSFGYTSPEDVAYHLLNVSKQLDISPENSLLLISGYIDEDSALCNEISKYFLHLEFDKIAYVDEQTGGEYPSHYFSYLLKLAECV